MIYAFLADGFEETEAIAPIDILRRAGFEVKTVGIGTNQPTSSHKIRLFADLTEQEVVLDDKLQLIILPGGMPGTTNLEASQTVQNTISYCVEHNIPVGAICAAPSILGKRGLLKGKKAVCYPGFEGYLSEAIVCYTSCETDGLFTTACGAGASLDFGIELVKVLCGEEKSMELKSKIAYDR